MKTRKTRNGIDCKRGTDKSKQDSDNLQKNLKIQQLTSDYVLINVSITAKKQSISKLQQ
jgi:hypothetical protein